MGTRDYQFTLNGEIVTIAGVSTNVTLADWLRSTGRTGTKIGCSEGDCGACSVVICDTRANGEPTYRAINSCIAFLPTLAGRTILTVEGVASGEKLHPVQTAMVDNYGSQCGYCTPGFIMALYEGYYRNDLKTKAQIADQLCGNLCRCTGYRPIRDAALQTCGQGSGKEELTLKALEKIEYVHDEERFFRPETLAELLLLKAQHPDAMLVAGATELGVYANKRFTRYKTLISLEAVSDLKTIVSTPGKWDIGAAADLTQIEEALGGEFPLIDKMLWVFAARQIRNRATLGGNLVTASPIGDMAPVLLALGASVKLTSLLGERVVPLAEFFTGYRQTVLLETEIMQSISIPREKGWRTESYKVSKRREMDISIVSAAFAVRLDENGCVQEARLAYGGVAATPLRAIQTERALIGQRLDFPHACEVLAGEFSPISDVRGSAEYRQALILGLWDKFVAGGKSESQDLPPDFTEKNYRADATHSHGLAHESARGHVTGRALYVGDVGAKRKMLDVWPVMAPYARARIIGRDASAALAMPGVRTVLLAGDVPGINDVGAIIHDEVLLADQEVFFHGQVVALVVGESVEICRRAAGLVKVSYEPLPHILTVAEAIAAESFHCEPNFMRRGDWVKGLAESPLRIEGEFEFGGQEHFYLETQAAWAEVDLEGNVLVSSSTQHPSEIQAALSHVLDLPRHRITVQAPRMGGGFGGKETQGAAWAALAALASLKTGEPVRVQLERDLDMQLTGKRHPFLAKFSVGFQPDGKLHALQCALFSNGGWSLDLSMPVTDRAMFHIDNAYYIPNIEVSGRTAKTNITSQTAFRGFGGPQGMLVIEEIMDRIARATGLAPEVVRERNFYHGTGETNTTHYGQEIEDNRALQIWHSLKEKTDFIQRRATVEAWNAGNERVKRGIAITPVKFGISFTLTHYNQAGALVLIYQDGTVQVNHGGTEMGQGLNTKILGIVMRELGLRTEQVRLMTTTTDKVPNTSATAASSGTDLNGAAVSDACRILRERLEPVAAEMLGGGGAIWGEGALRLGEKEIGFDKLVQAAYGKRISLFAAGYYRTPNIHWNRAEGRGRPFHYYACGAAVCEVEVDGYNGMSKVRRVDILHDVGDSLNAGIDRGQIEGGFVQGMGWLTREQLKWDAATGRLLTYGASTYAIPAFSDAPTEFNIELLPQATNPGTIHGSKAVGEPPLMLAISVREAIRDAVVAFGGNPLLASPASGEAILKAIQNR